MKKLCLLAGVAGLSLTLGACDMSPHHSATDLPPGQYNKTTHSTDANGTAYDRTTTTTVGYDANGDKAATTDSRTTTDPRGLFNKSTTTTSTTETAN